MVLVVPALSVRKAVLLPGMRCDLEAWTLPGIAALASSRRSEGGHRVAIFAAPNGAENPDQSYAVGTLGEVKQWQKKDDVWIADVVGLRRVRRTETLRTRPMWVARVQSWPDERDHPAALRIVAEEIVDAAWNMLGNKSLAELGAFALTTIQRADSLRALPAGFAAFVTTLPPGRQQTILEVENLTARLDAILAEMQLLLGESGTDRRH